MTCICLFGLFTEGCNAYGYACYGGHGKRSLHSQQGDATGMELNNLQERPDTVVQFYPSEANVLIDGNLEAIPRYKLIKMMKSWVSVNRYQQLHMKHNFILQ